MTFLIGFVVAVAVGLTGVGAGSITAPVLILLFGISPADGKTSGAHLRDVFLKPDRPKR